MTHSSLFLPQIQHQFIHEVINALTKPFDFSLYDGVDAADLEPIVEACKLFVIQTVNLGLTKEQVCTIQGSYSHIKWRIILWRILPFSS
jgi:hypothetical protein